MTTGPLILLRHGQSEWNAKNLFTGWVDVDLSETGEAEAVRGGQLLAEASESPLNNLILVAEAWEPHRLATLCESLQGHSFHAKFLVGQVESMEFQDFQLVDLVHLHLLNLLGFHQRYNFLLHLHLLML